MRDFVRFLNPIRQLGVKRYSIWLSFFVSLAVILLSEVYAYGIAKNPLVVSKYIIFVHVAMIIYFSFRNGIKGGITAVIFAIAYYFYIIDSRDYTGQRLTSGIETTIILTFLFLALAVVIGWLKQSLDTLIGREKDERRRLQAIIEQLPVGVVITDKDGYVIEVNKKVDQLLGMKLPIGCKVGREQLLETKRKIALSITITIGCSINDRKVRC